MTLLEASIKLTRKACLQEIVHKPCQHHLKTHVATGAMNHQKLSNSPITRLRLFSTIVYKTNPSLVKEKTNGRKK